MTPRCSCLLYQTPTLELKSSTDLPTPPSLSFTLHRHSVSYKKDLPGTLCKVATDFGPSPHLDRKESLRENRGKSRVGRVRGTGHWNPFEDRWVSTREILYCCCLVLFDLKTRIMTGNGRHERIRSMNRRDLKPRKYTHRGRKILLTFLRHSNSCSDHGYDPVRDMIHEGE